MKRHSPFLGLLFSASLCLVASCAAAKGGYSYRVKSGDTLATVASKHGQSEAALRQANNLSPQTPLRAGQILYVPEHSGAPGAVAAHPPRPAVAVVKETKLRARAPKGSPAKKSVTVKPPKVMLTWPLAGKVVHPFSLDKARRVKGIEVLGPRGGEVKAADRGTVIYSGAEVEGYEELVIIRHAGRLSTIYAWLAERKVRKGESVGRGQVLGRLGRHPHENGALLHFEVRQETTPIDPAAVLPRR